MLHFEHSSLIHAPPAQVFAFHAQPDAFELLRPGWMPARLVMWEGGLRKGARVEFLLSPLRIRWVAWLTESQEGRLFVEEQICGPFRWWLHRHEFLPEEGGTRLRDTVEFALPGGVAVEKAIGWAVKLPLRILFRYRHGVTRGECEKGRTAAA
jgi:ligand-binding SRPBCC domain-containing protein